MINIRKNADYGEMYEALDNLMAKELPQMDLYCEIGKAVCQRKDKATAVMASEYLNKHYQDFKGFSPRVFAECGIFIELTRNILHCYLV